MIDRARFEVDVRSYEIDLYRHVNNGAYLSWFEDGRGRFLEAGGRDYFYYPDREDAWFVVARIEADYLAPAHLGDTFEILTRLSALGRSSVVFRQSARRRSDGAVCARARVVMAFARKAGGSVPIPADFRQRFRPSTEGDVWTESEGGERG